MKLQHSKNKYSLFFPTTLIEALEWKKGNDIEVKIVGKGRIELRKK